MADSATDLSKLHDIVLPEPVGWWPPGPGWYVVGVLVLLCGGVLLFRYIQRWRANAYRREALRALGGVSSAEEIAMILRRTALAIVPRETVASLSGERWIQWMAARSPEPIPATVGDLLKGALYDGGCAEQDINALREFADHWIRNHRLQC